MPEVKIERIVSVSSEDPVHKAENLLTGKKWRSLNAGEAQVSIVLQLAKSAQISGIDIGNNGSAFVEVQVGRQASPNCDFKVILPASSFLTPIESRNETNQCRVRMFSGDKLNEEISKEKWDLIKIVCTQPFNKNIKYGLSFITINSVDDVVPVKEEEKPVVKLGAFRLKDEDESFSVGSLYKARQLKDSVATSLRSEATLASIALNSAEASRKRKDTSSTPPSSFAKKAKVNTGTSEKMLPRRDILSPGDRVETVKKEKASKPAKPAKKRDEKPTDVPKPKPPKTGPFNKLMSSVVFVISGFQNPLRGEIRQKAIEMGAKYRGDWDNSCTHLICAFINTPKFNQVKGKGKIVTKDWIEKSHRDRKLYPWRRYCLDPKDKGEESEEEVWDESLVGAAEKPKPIISEPDDDRDTDEELEELRRVQTQATGTKTKAATKIEQMYGEDSDENDQNCGNEAYDKDTDDEPSPKKVTDDPYEVETDVDDVADDQPLPKLPSYFNNKQFFLYGTLANEDLRKSVIRGIVAGNGKIRDYMSPEVDYVITTSDWDPNFEDARKVNSNITFVKPTFVQACFDADMLLPPSKHSIQKL